MHIAIGEVGKHEGKEVEFKGWVRARRDHGKIIFVDLRDRTGFVQVVLNPTKLPEAAGLRLEYLVAISGKVQPRPAGMVNKELPNGKIEVQALALQTISRAEEVPLPLDDAGYEVNEEVRLKYRYLDLRRERLAKNLRMRHKVIKSIRDFLDDKGFLEIETPTLTKSTPEGARDYLVPSRLEKGKFYALPQSPQQYKQLLMVAGVEKYFQIARCFRDEDTRGDRQPEFTQLDIEMSFVEREEVMKVNEELALVLIGALYPDKEIQETPFPRLSYAKAMKQYGTDRPDLRKDKNDPNLLAFCWITDFPFFEKTGEGKWTFTHNPFSAPKPEHEKDLREGKHTGEILTSQYDLVANGLELAGGSIRAHDPEVLTATFRTIGYRDEEIWEQFGHILQALSYGAPPHGGIAWGLDRFLAILENEPNIREVIAFPKTGDGRDPMMGSPAEVDKKQLDELGLEISKGGKKKK